MHVLKVLFSIIPLALFSMHFTINCYRKKVDIINNVRNSTMNRIEKEMLKTNKSNGEQKREREKGKRKFASKENEEQLMCEIADTK